MKILIKSIVFALLNLSILLAQNNYFPLEIGNYWIYNSICKTEIIDTIIINNKPYYSVNFSKHSVIYPVTHYRVDSSSILYGYDGNYEIILADFSLNVGDTIWPYSDIDSTDIARIFYTLQSITDTVVTSIGTFEECYRFKKDLVGGVGYEKYFWYAPDVGLVQYSVYDKVPITDAQIGGVVLNTNSDVKTISDGFRITSIYPNPFNPNTTIEYQLPKPGNVDVSIYNTAGKLIKEIESSYKYTGSYKVVWNSNNRFGEKVSSGIYLVRVKYNSQIQTQKLILLK